MLFNPQPVPITETCLSSYFKDRLARYARRLEPPPHDDTCWYLGTVLDRFGRSDALFCYQDERITLRPLALLYGDALKAGSDRERCLLLQQLGDMALFLGALFPERFARHGIDKDYFIGMGGGAYDYLAGNARHNRHVFAELAGMFGRMLEMVANVCSRTQAVTAADVLALYQRWMDSGDPLIERQLRALGIELSGSQRMQ